MKKIIILILLIMTIPSALASLKLENIQFDPAIIAAGDEVDIVIQFHNLNSGEENKIGNPDYKFKISLEADDSISKKYITIIDGQGKNLAGSVFGNQNYNKKFRIKVSPSATPANYGMKLIGRWYKNDKPETVEGILRFYIPVKKEGISMSIAQLITDPLEIKPGDNFVLVTNRIENVGEKDSKDVSVKLTVPEGIKPSYSNNNEIYIGRLNSGKGKNSNFNIDLDENLTSGVYKFIYTIKYMDLDNNKYSEKKELNFFVKPRPNLVVESYTETKAGKKTQIVVKVKNIGEESAESSDVRLLKQNSQPFTLIERSDYIGTINPGETKEAIFNIKIDSSAEIKKHDLELLIRAKGDSDEGDDRIYTYTRNATINVVGKAPNYFFIAGVMAVTLICGFFIWRKK